MTNTNTLYDNLNAFFDGFWKSKKVDLETEYKSIPTNTYNACMMYIYDNYVKSLEVVNPKGLRQYIADDYIRICEWYIAKSLEYDFISLFGFACLINRSMFFIKSILTEDDINNRFIFVYTDSTQINQFGANDPNLEFEGDLARNNHNYSNIDQYSNTEDYGVDSNIYSIKDSISKERYSNTLCNIRGKGDNLDTVSNYGQDGASAHIYDVTQKLYETIQQQTVCKLNDTTIGLVTNANNNKDVGLMYAKETAIEVQKAKQMISLSELPKLQ
jgi:hypothetical protein